MKKLAMVSLTLVLFVLFGISAIGITIENQSARNVSIGIGRTAHDDKWVINRLRPYEKCVFDPSDPGLGVGRDIKFYDAGKINYWTDYPLLGWLSIREDGQVKMYILDYTNFDLELRSIDGKLMERVGSYDVDKLRAFTGQWEDGCIRILYTSRDYRPSF